MAIIDTLTFRLGDHTDDAAFLAADRRVQTEFVYLQPGLVRRTTARDDDGEWIVVSLWNSAADADAAAARAQSNPVVSQFATLLDESTVRARRYTTLD